MYKIRILLAITLESQFLYILSTIFGFKKYAMQFLIKIRDLLHTSYQNYFL